MLKKTKKSYILFYLYASKCKIKKTTVMCHHFFLCNGQRLEPGWDLFQIFYESFISFSSFGCLSYFYFLLFFFYILIEQQILWVVFSLKTHFMQFCFTRMFLQDMHKKWEIRENIACTFSVNVNVLYIHLKCHSY